FLAYMAELAGLWGDARHERVAAVLGQVHLADATEQPIHTLSKGMLQRLAIAQALLTDPELLILDEPTSGLDPRGQLEVRQIIAALRRQGKTVLLCSHHLAEVEQLCDAVGILRRGRLVSHGAVAELLRVDDAVEIALDEHRPAGEVAERLGLKPRLLSAQGN